MLANVVNWLNVKEGERANRAREAETHRSNLANEAETRRSNIARETETNRSNLAKEAETKRSNLAREAETHRSNVANEQIGWANVWETNRHNVAVETETNRSNLAMEKLKRAQNKETKRHNKEQESIDLKNAATKRYQTISDIVIDRERSDREAAKLGSEVALNDARVWQSAMAGTKDLFDIGSSTASYLGK